ncbi:hypothetical protein M501DRAFT_927634, partial [Patellaria atrata CBS 101060]
LTDDIPRDAAVFFSEQYGIWDPSDPFGRYGKRVRTNIRRLRDLLPVDAENIYVRVLVAGELAGHVFASRWTQGRKICWITQLVIKRIFRRRGIATALLLTLRQQDDLYGVLSSNPATILATWRALGGGSKDIDLSTTQKYAIDILRSSLVEYVNGAKVHGSLFHESHDGSASTADTGLHVCYDEPSEILATIQQRGTMWPLGELLEGHEYIILVEPTP